MTISNIVKGINTELAGELLTYNELEQFMDQTIDDINQALDTTYPTFSECRAEDPTFENYDYFPEIYIREVVIKGAAYKFYVMDEEGIPTAQQFNYNYQDNLFRMQRDYIDRVPEEYQADHTGAVHHLSDVAWKHPWIGDYTL